MPRTKVGRPSWDEWFILLTHLNASRATCDRFHAGAVIVKDRRIIATGFNGSPSGVEHCETAGCTVIDNHCVSTVHSEVNAITSAAKLGISLEGATMYVKGHPCLRCANTIANSGITLVITDQRYDYHQHVSAHSAEQKRAREVFAKAGVLTKTMDGDFLNSVRRLLADFSREDLLRVGEMVSAFLGESEK